MLNPALTGDEVIQIWAWLGLQRHLDVIDVVRYREWRNEINTLERWYAIPSPVPQPPPSPGNADNSPEAMLRSSGAPRSDL